MYDFHLDVFGIVEIHVLYCVGVNSPRDAEFVFVWVFFYPWHGIRFVLEFKYRLEFEWVR